MSTNFPNYRNVFMISDDYRKSLTLRKRCEMNMMVATSVVSRISLAGIITGMLHLIKLESEPWTG